MSSEAQLRCYMNLMAFDSMPQSSGQRFLKLRDAGFEGVQFVSAPGDGELALCRDLGLGITTSGRVNTPHEAEILAEQAAGEGFECATLHVGWGLESEDEALRLIEAVLHASERWSIPLYFETHRATICQDMWRTVDFVRRFPEMLFNGDFSHWYAGQEMVYGGFEQKFEFIRPVLERVRFIHGRIASPGCIQVAISDTDGEEPIYVKHFRQLWTASFQSFLHASAPRDRIYFVPELLAPDIFYARTFENEYGGLVEESDRWDQSLLLMRIAKECFASLLLA